METTEAFVQPGAESGIVLNFEAQAYLRESGKWASFLGILGFILCGFVLLAAIFAGSIVAMFAKFSPDPSVAVAMSGLAGFITVIYLLIALIYFFFSLYLYQFGTRIKKGIVFTDVLHVTSALGKLKSFFKLWGIITIIILCVYVIMIIGLMVLGAGMASMMHK